MEIITSIKDWFLEFFVPLQIPDGVFAFAILFVAYISRTLISKILCYVIYKELSKVISHDVKELFDSLNRPLRMVNIVAGLYIVSELYLPILSGTVVLTALSILLFWIVYALLLPVGELIIKINPKIRKTLLRWIIRVIKVVIIFIAIATTLELWGIQVGAILAGLGILGAAVALGTQDLFKNLIAGLLILSERRFNEGEWILVKGVVEGSVENIGLRSTLLRRFDQAPMHVPNSQLADVPLINFSRMKYRRIYWSIGLEYSATTSQLEAVVQGIRDLITKDDFVDDEEISTFVVVDKFSESSIDVLVYCFTKTTDWGEWLFVKEKLAKEIKELVESTGTGFAFPSQSIYVEKMGDFIPPKV